MDLKQECIDMIRLITDPLAEKDDLYEYEINEDSCIGFCLETGEDDYSCFCCDCEKYKQCNRSRMVYIKTDIELTSPCMADDCCWYFVFGKEEEYKALQGKIHYINTHEELVSIMKEYKKRIEEFKDGYADFGNRYSDIMEYAKEFAEQIKLEHNFFRIINPEILPIVMHWDYRNDHEWGEKTFTAGDFQTHGKQSVMNIYCSMDAGTEDIKQRIRHEILHYCLFMAGLKNSDEDAIFHYLCGLYDAHAYKEMAEEEQDLYNKLLKVKQIIEDEKTFTDEEKKNSINLFVDAVGTKQEDMDNEHYISTAELLRRILCCENKIMVNGVKREAVSI